jgi:hypothetical protein
MQLLMSRSPRVSVLSVLTRAAARTALRIADVAAEFIAPAPLPAEKPVELAEDPTDVYTADELPALEDIEAAAAEYQRAGEQARRADRGKRAAKKILDRLPAGTYGRWIVERVSNNRQVADLDQIRAIFKQHGLGPVPMKQSAPSLKVRQLADAEMPAEFEILAGAVA